MFWAFSERLSLGTLKVWSRECELVQGHRWSQRSCDLSPDLHRERGSGEQGKGREHVTAT